MVSSALSPNSDNKRALGEKLALLALIVVLSEIGLYAEAGSAVNRDQ